MDDPTDVSQKGQYSGCMKNEFLKFWDEAPLDRAPFVHPRDMIPANHIQSGVSSYAEFLAAFEGGLLSRTTLHLSLLPQRSCSRTPSHQRPKDLAGEHPKVLYITDLKSFTVRFIRPYALRCG